MTLVKVEIVPMSHSVCVHRGAFECFSGLILKTIMLSIPYCSSCYSICLTEDKLTGFPRLDRLEMADFCPFFVFVVSFFKNAIYTVILCSPVLKTFKTAEHTLSRAMSLVLNRCVQKPLLKSISANIVTAVTFRQICN